MCPDLHLCYSRADYSTHVISTLDASKVRRPPPPGWSFTVINVRTTSRWRPRGMASHAARTSEASTRSANTGARDVCAVAREISSRRPWMRSEPAANWLRPISPMANASARPSRRTRSAAASS
jgi:hypothetical protein